MLDILAAAARTNDLAFLIVNNGQDFIEELLALTTQEFVVGHRHSTMMVKPAIGILGAPIGLFNVGCLEPRTARSILNSH